jgi:hypothetical protein
VADAAPLSQRRLNRALLARQLLLERAKLPLPRAVERVGGLQSQYAPSAYIGLWSRLEGFERPALTRALERRSIVQATLMRTTIHIVSAGDFALFTAGVAGPRRESWLDGRRSHATKREIEAAARHVAKRFGGQARSKEEVAPELDAMTWNGVGVWLELVRVPPSGTWERRRADLYATSRDWLGAGAASEADGRDHLLRRYLGAFGPATLKDAANWAGLPPKLLAPSLDRVRVRRLTAEDGTELVDLPRAPLPPEDAPAPPRFLGTWDATLLVHARRSGLLPEEYRALVFSTKTPHSLPTFAVDGAVAGSWRVERTRAKATLRLNPFAPLPRGVRAGLREEAERLVRWHEDDAPSHEVRIA